MTDESAMHALDDAVSFGEVVAGLRTLMRLPPGSPIARHQLRNLLRKGDLTAFVFVPGTPPREVQIPSAYWASVSTKRFASVGSKTRSGMAAGAYSLRLSEIAKAVADSFRPAVESRNLAANDAFFLALERSFAEAETRLEAFVSQGVFDLWITRSKRNPQEQYVVAGKKGPGAPTKNWEAVFATLVTILAEIIKKNRKMPSMLALAHDIHERAVAQHPDIPVVGTIEGKIGELINPT